MNYFRIFCERIFCVSYNLLIFIVNFLMAFVKLLNYIYFIYTRVIDYLYLLYFFIC
jgi:hypothetical protein